MEPNVVQGEPPFKKAVTLLWKPYFCHDNHMEEWDFTWWLIYVHTRYRFQHRHLYPHALQHNGAILCTYYVTKEKKSVSKCRTGYGS